MQENNNTDPIIKEFHEQFRISMEYCQEYFELSVRLYELWRGKLPDALDGTFSKMMMNTAHAVVQDRIPKLMTNLFARNPSLRAQKPQYEFYKRQAEMWLVDMLTNPAKINLRGSIMPTMQSVCVMGTGYRMPCVRMNQDEKGNWQEVITSKDIDFFQILPAPNGGLLNPIDRWSDDAVPHFFYIDWMTDEQIKALEKYEGFNKDAVTKMIEQKATPDSSIDQQYYERYKTIAGVSYGADSIEYRRKMADAQGKNGKRRVVHWFKRDKWYIIAQDYYKVYEGPNPLGGGLLPLTKWAITPDFKNWFGISGLEMAEDLIIAKIMNFNYRMDYLAQVMFPTQWIREDIIAGKPESMFARQPYAIHSFPDRTNIREALHVDRMPEITGQTFIEDDRMMMYLQEVLGLPNYSRGMSGEGTLANETASGILSLIKQAQGRLGMESMQLEYNGLAQECRLLLALASKYIHDPVVVEDFAAKDGFRWTSVTPDALADAYTVVTHGTQYIEEQETNFQKILALYPMWNNNPLYDQYELHSQMNEAVGVLPDYRRAMLPPQNNPQPAPATGSLPMGGWASMMDMTQRTRGVPNRNTVQPDTGNLVPANSQI